ncbi:MAG TPA: flotillin family protein, partial [Thermoanaerobaculia bacterium]|nr:flotillin family protein [Thermoanaerobaculia bacterium]
MVVFSFLFWLVLGLVFLFIAYLFVKFRYKKAGPDEALIIYGRRKLFGAKLRDDKGKVEGFHIVRGGGSFVIPAWEQAEFLSLKMMTLEIDLKHVYTI